MLLAGNFETSTKNNKVNEETELLRQNGSKNLDEALALDNSVQGFLSSPEGILQLQKSVGNQGVLQLLEDEHKDISNETGLPDSLKGGIESLSGFSMDDVKVHYNSSKPARVNALAYTQGTDIHVGPGQEKHLPHEAWHVVQQKQGRVQPTKRYNKLALNDSHSLEREADVLGGKALQAKAAESSNVKAAYNNYGEDVIQLFWKSKSKSTEDDENKEVIDQEDNNKDAFGWLAEKAEKDNKAGLVKYFHGLDENKQKLVIHLIANKIDINDLVDIDDLRNAYEKASKEFNNNNDKFKKNMRKKLRYLYKMDWCKWDMFSETIRSVSSLTPYIGPINNESQEKKTIEKKSKLKQLGVAVASALPIGSTIKAATDYIGNTTITEKFASDSLVTDSIVLPATKVASGTKAGMDLLGSGATSGAVAAAGFIGIAGGTWLLASGVAKTIAANKEQKQLEKIAAESNNQEKNIKLGELDFSTADIAKAAANTKGLEKGKGAFRAAQGAAGIATGALLLAASPAALALGAVGIGILAASSIYKYYKKQKNQKEFVDHVLGTNEKNRKETINEKGFNTVEQFYNYSTKLMAKYIYEQGVEGNDIQYKDLIAKMGFKIDKDAKIPKEEHILIKLRGY